MKQLIGIVIIKVENLNNYIVPVTILASLYM